MRFASTHKVFRMLINLNVSYENRNVAAEHRETSASLQRISEINVSVETGVW